MVESAESVRVKSDASQFHGPGARHASGAGSAAVGGDGVRIVHGDEINVAAVIAMLWAHRYLVLLSTLLFGAAAAALAFTTPRSYRAQVVLTQVNNQAEGAGALARRLGELVNVGGINLESDNSAQYANAVLESRRLIEEFIRRNNLLPQLAIDPRHPPDMWKAVQLFQRSVLFIRQDVRKAETTVDVEWGDPVVAARWANGLVALTNELIRTRALEEAKRNIGYLESQVERTSDVELRRVMYSLIQNETKNLMLANERPEYAFRIVDPAVPPEIPSGPHRQLMVAIGLILGLLFGALVAYARTYLFPPQRR